MCLTCGCHRPDDDHGDPRHITMRRLQDAAAAADETTADAVANIVDTLRPMPVRGNPWLSGVPSANRPVNQEDHG